MKNGRVSRASKFSVSLAIAAAFLISSGAVFGQHKVSPDTSGFTILPAPPVSGGGDGNHTLATIEWANVGTDWATGSNWVGGTAPANSTTTDIASFGTQNGAPVNPVLSAARSVGGVSFLAGAFAYTISGSALTIGSSGISNSATNTETFSNSVGPSINSTWTTAAGGTTVFNGAVNINSTSAANRFLTISGAGTTTINGVVQNSFAGSTGHLTYSGTGTLNLANTNTYNGGTVINSGTVVASKDGAFGSGNVSLTASGITLTLQSGATNNYIADTANLSILSGQTINLNFVGTDTIGALIVNGVSQPLGLYGAAGTNPSGDFNGSGFLLVTVVAVPERSTWTMLVIGAALLLGVQRWRRRRTS